MHVVLAAIVVIGMIIPTYKSKEMVRQCGGVVSCAHTDIITAAAPGPWTHHCSTRSAAADAGADSFRCSESR